LDKGKAATIKQLNAFISLVKVQRGKAISKEAADLLIADAQWVIAHMP
jgi:hypothetical protein